MVKKCIKIQIQDTSEKKYLIQDTRYVSCISNTYLVSQIRIANTCISNTTQVWISPTGFKSILSACHEKKHRL